MNSNVYFAKLHPNAYLPKKRLEDAGYDVYTSDSHAPIIFEPHETKLLPTGICSSFGSDLVAVVKERGSTGSKGLGVRAGIIDSGYRGEWFIALTNHNDKPLIMAQPDYHLVEDAIIYPITKAIAQVLFLPVPVLNVVEVDVEMIKDMKSERGLGSLGSSGK